MDYQNFKRLVAKANAHHHTKFHQNRSIAAKLLQLTLFKMAVNRHPAFLKFEFLKTCKLLRTNVSCKMALNGPNGFWRYHDF